MQRKISLPDGFRWTPPADTPPSATQPDEFTKLPYQYPAIAEARPGAPTCPFPWPVRLPSWRDAISLPHSDHCLIRERFRFFLTSLRVTFAMLLLPAAFDTYADITRIRYNAGLGNFNSRPLRIEFFEYPMHDRFRERFEQVEGM